MQGFAGKILTVNLSTKEINEQAIAEEIYKNYLSGVGLGAWYLYHNIPAGADPLGPDNILGFLSGILTGTGSLVTGRWMVVCKSPLTGGWGDANCGGTLSPAIKQCGFDGIFFSGISEKPVYLVIDEEGARLEDASSLWGKDSAETENLLEKKHKTNKKPAIAVIGPSAEKLSLISGICNDRGRLAARSGCGAVMGAKKLKAVVLAGSKKIEAYDKKIIRELSKEYAAAVKKAGLPGVVKGSMIPWLGMIMGKMPYGMALDGVMILVSTLKKWGTIMSNSLGVTSGDLPIKNWGGSVAEYNHSYYKHLNPDLIIERETKKYHCYSCVIGCGGICKIDDLCGGEFTETHKPEYETCAVFGGLLMNKDLDSIFYINELLNRAGMDSISAGNTVAFAIECFENGLLDESQTDGLKLNWGNAPAIVELVKKMIDREGSGDLFADGVKKAAEQIGPASNAYAMHAGGQEPGMHDPRYDPLMGIHFSADPTPGRHTIGCGTYYNMMHLWEQVSWAPKSELYKKSDEYLASDNEALKAVAGACYKQVVDGAGGCLFAAISGVQHWPVFQWLNAATGWDYTPDQYMEKGKRIQTLRQLFNIREGVEPLSFKMPDRLSGLPPLKEGPLKGKALPIEAMMKNYWKHFGWNETSGAPDKTSLELISE